MPHTNAFTLGLAMFELLQLLLAAIAFAYLGLILLALWIAPRMIFPRPPSKGLPIAGELRIPWREGKFVTALYHPHPGASRLLLYHHGNAEDLEGLAERLGWYQARGFAVLAYDYPGYGTSDGVPTARTVEEAAEAVLAYANETLGWAHDAIISYGRSLGGAPCLILAARHALAGAVLEGTFTSTFRVMTRRRLLPWDIFDNLALIRRARCPVLIIHGRRDQTVPFDHAKKLLASAPPGTRSLWIAEANHVDVVEVGGETYWTTLDQFAHPDRFAEDVP